MPAKKEWKWGYINREGEFAISPHYDDAWDFHEGLGAVKIDWARGYINTKGEIVIPMRYEKAGPFIDGIAEVMEDGEVKYINRKGVTVAPPPSYTKNPSASHSPTLSYLTDPTLPPSPENDILSKYFEAGVFSEGLAAVKKGASSKWGYIDETGQSVIPPRFHQAGEFHEGLAPVLVRVEIK